MLGPSGFFIPGKAENSISDSDDLELIHISKDGVHALYRGCKNGRFFVYKGLKEEYRGNLMYEELLKKDFNIGFSLSHNGICQYYGMIDHPKVGNCIIMEWVDGRTLESLINEVRTNGTLARKIICEICDALGYMHSKQIIHRDLKPENIMITHNGNNVKIIDFGLSDADSYNAFKSPAGTRAYASPELIQGEMIDHRSDIWSLGIIIREFGTKYRHISQRCTRRDRTKRYASCHEVKKAILHDGYRKLLVWGSIIGISVLLIVAEVLYTIGKPETPATVNEVPIVAAETFTPAETPAPAETPVQPAIKDITEEISKPQSHEDLDATSLEDMFNEAAQQIL